jgi:glutaredoxin-related protein
MIQSQPDSFNQPSILNFYEVSMPRPILDDCHIHSTIRNKVAGHQQTIVQEVMAAIKDNNVVVVGMGLNPFPKLACKSLDKIKQPYKYLKYGNYFNTWRKRNALKMWTGWPTFPMVFVKGTLIGGAEELKTLIASGEFNQMLASSESQS